MEIRPEILEKLLRESDDRLWETIRRVAVMNNITLPTTAPSKEEMAKLRAVLGSGNISYEDAMGILSRHKDGGKP